MVRAAQVPVGVVGEVGRGLGWGNFLCGFVPGLLQFRLGQRARAGVALGSCLLLFFLGWLMVRDRLFFFALLAVDSTGSGLTRELGRFGLPLTLPELLNLPGLLLGSWLSWESGFEAERMWRLPRQDIVGGFEHLGGFLTAASGMLAAFWAADATWTRRWRRDARDDTRAPVCNPALAAGVSWLLPGLGHWRAGQRDKGLLMGAAVAIVFALGLVFSQGHGMDRGLAPVWWMGQSLFGGGALFAALVTAPLEMASSPGGIPENLDLGTVLCTVAGLMNLVVMIDAFTVAERSSFPLPRAKEGAK
jgi:hypothetical protein